MKLRYFTAGVVVTVATVLLTASIALSIEEYLDGAENPMLSALVQLTGG